MVFRSSLREILSFGFSYMWLHSSHPFPTSVFIKTFPVIQCGKEPSTFPPSSAEDAVFLCDELVKDDTAEMFAVSYIPKITTGGNGGGVGRQCLSRTLSAPTRSASGQSERAALNSCGCCSMICCAFLMGWIPSWVCIAQQQNCEVSMKDRQEQPVVLQTSSFIFYLPRFLIALVLFIICFCWDWEWAGVKQWGVRGAFLLLSGPAQTVSWADARMWLSQYWGTGTGFGDDNYLTPKLHKDLRFRSWSPRSPA